LGVQGVDPRRACRFAFGDREIIRKLWYCGWEWGEGVSNSDAGKPMSTEILTGNDNHPVSTSRFGFREKCGLAILITEHIVVPLLQKILDSVENPNIGLLQVRDNRLKKQGI
jgi:hypothetical protein